ncbi:MAG TPA: conjugal transfer protein TraH [Alphaproteobacteria bacterium]|nr:conjugal transfer protein TraH [Alphaproteobacteria bacterium]
MKHSVLYTLCILLLLNPSSQASMQKNLETAFEKLGMANNLTTGGGYQDQTGGFYTGGSVFARSKVNNADLLSIQMPHYRSGCGGIDLFLGGFSFINAQQFTQLLRNIGSNASGYAFNLALATVTPQIKSVLDDLAAKVHSITNQSINSCEAAATLVGGVWPQSNASSQLLCNAMGKELGLASDWAQSRQKCGTEEKRDAWNSRKNEKEGFKDILGDEFNIAWKAIQKNGFLSRDPQLAELFMTVSGTIISRRVSSSLEVKVLPSKSSDPQLISGLITGNVPIQIYKCDNASEDKCLSPTLQQITLPAEKALYGQVHRLLLSLSQKVREDKALSKTEIGFVNATQIPVLKIMAVEAAFKAGGSPLSAADFSEAIAHDILLQYLEEVMTLVFDSVTQLQKTQINDQMVEELRQGISKSRKLLFAKRTALFEQMAITLDLIERTQQIETKLQNMFISHQQGTKAGGF